MIKFYARKPIRDFINAVTEPPYSLQTDEHNKYLESILEVYEESTNKERQDFLCADTFVLLKAFVDEDRAINRKDPKDTHRLSMIEIRLMLAGLIAAAKQWGVCLPDSEIKRYEKVDFINGSFAQFVRGTYNPSQPFDYLKRKEPKRTPATPASKEPGNTLPPPAPKKAGRKIEDNFDDIIAVDYLEQRETIKQEIAKMLANKQEAESVILFFVACMKKAIIKKCPKHKQVTKLLEDNGYSCNFGDHTAYSRKKNIYFVADDTIRQTVLANSTALYDVEIELKPLVKILKNHQQPATNEPV